MKRWRLELDERIWQEIYDHMNGRYCLNDVYQQINNKECTLSKRCREYVLSFYDEQGNFKHK